MYHSFIKLITAEVSGVAAKNMVGRISQWHRIQASPMYREAAVWLHQTLQQWGLETTLESFPAREGVRAWGEPMFQEWNCDDATLHLVDADGQPTRLLADYRAVPLSLLPRSIATDGIYDVAVIDGGDRAEDYDDVDVRGKLVLTDRMPMAIHHLAVEQFGAAGMIFDGMRSIPDVCPPGDLPDDIQYASWWWWGGETRAFGFALSPRAGGELRRMAARRARTNAAPLRVKALVRSQFTDGHIEAVTARIPGRTDEEVLIVGHLCHPAPCANDNASGAAAVMETARALHTLISSGRLETPQRSIRFLWIPEMTGTYAYLAAHEDCLPRTVAGLNLDMVGEDQEQCRSTWLICRTADSLPSFATDLVEAIRESYVGEQHSFSGRGDYPAFRHAVVPYSNGSDHYILGDPSVGIPTPLLIQWPDRFYHTTADTLEKVSPASLERAATVAGTYAYLLASAGGREARWLAREMNDRFEIRLVRELNSAVNAALAGTTPHGPDWADQVAFRVERQQVALDSLRRLDADFDTGPAKAAAEAIGDGAWSRARDVLETWRAAPRPVLPADVAAQVPQRRFRGPISLRSYLPGMEPDQRTAARETLRKHSSFMGMSADLALYWADGKRTLGEIARLLELEAGVVDPDGLAAYFELLANLDLLILR